MKALSVRQPWAWLIVNGYKTVENRTWRTTHRGPLAIQASNTIEHDAIQAIIADCKDAGDPVTPDVLREMQTTGCIVGTVNVTGCTRKPSDPGDLNWHNPECWAWVLRDAKPLAKPIQQKGQLGLFDVDL